MAVCGVISVTVYLIWHDSRANLVFHFILPSLLRCTAENDTKLIGKFNPTRTMKGLCNFMIISSVGGNVFNRYFL